MNLGQSPQLADILMRTYLIDMNLGRGLNLADILLMVIAGPDCK